MDPQTIYIIVVGSILFVAVSLYVSGTTFIWINMRYNPNNKLHWMCKHGLFPFFVLKAFRRLLNRFDGAKRHVLPSTLERSLNTRWDDVCFFACIAVFAVCLLVDFYTFPIQAAAFLCQLPRLNRHWKVQLIKRKLLRGSVVQRTKEQLLCSFCPNGAYRCV